MLDQFKILTVTHKKTNLKEIGKFVIKTSDKDALKFRLEGLKEQFNLRELLYVATCNRVMYFFHADTDLDHTFASHFLQSVNPTLSIDILNNIEDYISLYQGQDAMEHLFDVASSIDSLVIGERQILRQLREAYEQCHVWGLTGDNLRLAFQNAVVAAKSVYANTRIGNKPVSIVSLAFQKMLKAHVTKEDRILLVGAGQTNQLVAKFLAKHHFTKVTVFNRSIEKAEQLAKLLGSRALPLAELENFREGFDCMIVCTGATKPIINKGTFDTLVNGDDAEKVIIDLAIPHNVETEVSDLEQVNYIEIDGLRCLAKENLAFREQEVTKAKVLLDTFIKDFPSQLRQRQIEIALRTVPQEIKAVKQKALQDVFREDMDMLDDQTRLLVEKMMTYMEKKCIGIPMRAARQIVLP